MKSGTVVQIFKNVFSNWGTIGVRSAIGLFIVPFVIGRLGKEGYGVVGIIMSMIGFAEIADLGLRAALSRELSEKAVSQDKAGFQQLSSTALVLYLGIALSISVVIALLAPAICSLYRIGPQYRGVALLLLRTYSPAMIILSFVTPVFTAGFASFMRYDVQNHIRTGSQILVSLLLILVLYWEIGNPIVAWCAVMAFGELLQLIVMAFFYSGICFGGRLSIKYVDPPCLLPLFRLGGGLYLLQLSSMLTSQSVPVIISRYLGIGSVAIYQAGARVPTMVLPLIMSGVNQLLPLTTKLHVAKNQAREQSALIMGTKYTFYLGAFFSAAMIVFADPFCHLWLFDQLGNDVGMVALILKLWSVMVLLNAAGGMQWPVVVGKKKIWPVICYHFPASLLSVCFSVFFVKYMSYGLKGVAYGIIIGELIRRPIATCYVSGLVGMKIRHYIVNAYIPPMIYFSVLLLLGWRVSGFFVSGISWGKLILSCAVFACGEIVLFGVFEWRLVRLYLLRNR
jgi:O-antigen/teichoic acid export membrane protein